jgi:homoserine kinase
MSEWITAFAPASIGNLAVGFDMLGLALEGVGDRVAARKVDGVGVSIAEVRGLDGRMHPYLSADPESNTASIAAQALWDAQGQGGGIEIKVFKGVPLQSGMGSSAASAVAAVVAVNALLDEPLEVEALLPHALAGEQFASGGLHADNVAASLLGGMVLCPQVLLPHVMRMPVPDAVSAVLLHPDLQVNTAQARRGLAKNYPMQDWLAQQGLLAGFVLGCAENNLELIRKTLRDTVVEPQRRDAVACFDAVKQAAEKNGVLGCSLSGSGPSIFALCLSSTARNVASSMEQACRAQGIGCQSWISSLSAPGARVEAQ